MASAAIVQAASVAPIAASTPMKKKAPAAAHPSTAVMVFEAVRELREKNGSSLSAIKKYLSTNFKVDSTKHAPFIRKYLKSAVANGELVQTYGTGAMGRFRLPVAPIKKKPVAAKKPSAAAAAKKKVAAKKPSAKAAASAGTPKKKKLSAKKAPTAAEPPAKKPKKSLVKAKKPVVASKPPKAKKTTTVKKVKSPKKK